MFKHKNDLLYPLMTFEVILNFFEILRLLKVSIHIPFYQNWFLNKEKNPGVLEFFLMRCRRTYVLNKVVTNMKGGNLLLKYIDWDTIESLRYAPIKK